jgi:exonuclease III
MWLSLEDKGDIHLFLMNDVLTWNMRGLNDSSRRTLGHYIRLRKADIVLLQESKLADCDARTWREIGGSWMEGCYVGAAGCSGGQILGWREDVFSLDDYFEGEHVISVRLIQKTSGARMVVTGVYGSSDTQARGVMWEEFSEVATGCHGCPWLIGGDFNITL